MKNGTRSSHRLTLVDNNGHSFSSQTALEDVAVDARGCDDYADEGESIDLLHSKVLFASVSVAFLTAAIAAGAYAVWLARRTSEGVSSVHDLLNTCQSRMKQMEKDLSGLPQAKSA